MNNQQIKEMLYDRLDRRFEALDQLHKEPEQIIKNEKVNVEVS